MGFSNRQYRKGEKPHPLFSNNNGPNKFNQYFYLRMGVIEEIDLDKYQMVVRWADWRGVRNRVPISFAYAGPAGCMGMLPEKGSLGIFGFYDEGDGKGSPLCLAFLPAGLNAGLNFNKVKIYPDAIPTSDINEIQYKFRKLTEGDMIMSSPLGGTVFLNKNVEIYDGAQDSIYLREGDQSILSTSLNNFIFCDGASVYAGPVIRNGMALYDDKGNKLPNNGSLVSFPDGRDSIYIVPYGDKITYETQYYTEYRVDVDELGDGKLDLNDINGSTPLSSRDPIITMALGNYIGADRKNPQLYGLNLKARLFSSSSDSKGSFCLEKAIQTNGIDEPAILGLVYALHSLKSGNFIGIDKEGHYYMNLPASKINPLGAGRSMSILAQGNLKEIWGSTATENNSWDLTTSGGLKWNIGSHNTKLKSRSIDIKTNGGVYLEINGKDDDGNSKYELIKGNVVESVNGNKTENCSNLTLNINGLKKDIIGGSASEIVQSDKSVSVSGVYSEIVVKEMQGKFGKRKVTITTGNDELEVLKGNIQESIKTFGKRITKITSGGIEETITAGTYKTAIKVGSYKLNVSTGSVEIKTSLGTITINGTTVDIKGQIMVNVSAPIVRLGKNAPIGGVITGLPGIPSHMDFCTGAPLLGSMTVGASK